MSKVRVAAFSVSLDGYGAGPDQALERPLGTGGEALHAWAFPTHSFQTKVFGGKGGSTGVDEAWAARSFDNVGAWILGRNMFGPVRGPWQDGPDGPWRGWWGEEPSYRVPVFVLTHHARAPLEMKGGTIFHFVTGGTEEALERAKAAAGDKDVRIGGGAATIRQYLQGGAIDELHLAVSPVLLGSGEALFAGLDLPALGYGVRSSEMGEGALHVLVTRL